MVRWCPNYAAPALTDGYCVATVIGKMLSNLKYLTVIIPDVVALHASNVTLAGLIDSASAQPVLYLEYLYCTGSESNSFGRLVCFYL